MTKPLLLDLFCCQGGASAGYVAAGFEVVGVDLLPQPRYPYEFIHMGAYAFLEEMILTGYIERYAAIHASPPCQAHSNAQRIMANQHPDLIGGTRDLLKATGLPYVIENVVGAPLIDPIMLCGTSFGLHTYRHRLFESNINLCAPDHEPHVQQQVKMGRPLREGDFYQAVGNFSNVPYVRADLGVSWMTREGMRECIPPAYTENIGGQIMAHL